MERFEDLEDGSGNRPLLTPIEIENRVTDEVRAGRCASTPAAIVARLVECGLSEDEARQTVNRMKLTQTLPTKGIPVNAHFLDLVPAASVELVPAVAAVPGQRQFHLTPFVTPASPDVEPILLLHRGNDEKHFITFHRKLRSGNFENLFSVPAGMLKGLWEQVAGELEEDSYFSVNAFYRPARWKSKITDQAGNALPGAERSRKMLRWLTAAFVDIDCHKLGIDIGTVIKEVVNAQDEGRIPPASLITRSGRGVWLFWFLQHDSGVGLVGGFPDKVELWCALQGAIGQHPVFSQLGSDTAARDVSRISRVAGSVNTKAMKRVAYWVQVASDGKVPAYGLNELAQLFGVPLLEKKRAPPPAVNMAVSIYKVRARKGNAGYWRWAMENFRRLWKLRGRFKQGTRHNACWLYASLLRSQPKRITEHDVLTAVETLWREGCQRTADWTADELQTAFKGSSRLASIRSQRMADLLDVTPEEAALLHNWPPASRFKPIDADSAAKLNRPQRTKRRREYLRQLIDGLPIMPTLRELEDHLEQVGMKAAPATVAADLVALGIVNERADAKLKAKRAKVARAADPKLFP